LISVLKSCNKLYIICVTKFLVEKQLYEVFVLGDDPLIEFKKYYPKIELTEKEVILLKSLSTKVRIIDKDEERKRVD